MPWGRPETIEAKIISEIPLPMPRWVISSPNHISSTQPAVSEITISISSGKVSSPPTTTLSPLPPKDSKRKT